MGPVCGVRSQECPVRLGKYRPVQDLRRRAGPSPGGGVRFPAAGTGRKLRGRRAAGAGGDHPRQGDVSGPATRPARPANALREVDYLSTASGGGLAAAAYVGSLRDYCIFHGSAQGYSFAAAGNPRLPPPATERAAGMSRASSPTPNCGRAFSTTTCRTSSTACSLASAGAPTGPFPAERLRRPHSRPAVAGGEAQVPRRRRGRRWRPYPRRRTVTTACGYRTSSCRIRTPWCLVRVPYWVANATTYENAAIFPFTRRRLRLYQITAYTHRLQRIRARRGGL